MNEFTIIFIISTIRIVNKINKIGDIRTENPQKSEKATTTKKIRTKIAEKWTNPIGGRQKRSSVRKLEVTDKEQV
jgi:hypothetical protein